MKRFITLFFAVIGFAVVAIIALAVTFVSVRGERAVPLPSHMVLTLSLDNGVQEAQSESGLFSPFAPQPANLQSIVQTLELARQDARVAGLSVHLNQTGIGIASVQELRDAVLRFRKSGKFAYLYADTLGNGPAMSEYWLATGFDQVWLQPLGELAITGFTTELPFAKDFLDKLGVKPELLHQGRFKSYPEMAMRNGISEDNRLMTESLLSSLQKQFEGDVGKARGLLSPQLETAMRNSPLPAEDAVTDGLIDAIGYRDEFDAYLETKTRGAKPVDFAEYQANGPRNVPGEKIALINVLGALSEIPEEESSPGETVSAEEASGAIDDAAEEPAIKAIIVRVDSPGGTPLAADMIRRSIQLARAQKPVIISMGNAAASGGYWMSAGADAIIAQPGTLTGSIGVFGGKVNLQGLWEKLGVHWDSVGQNPESGLWSPNRPYDDASRAKIDATMKRTYDQFKDYVGKGRKLSPEKVEDIAQGRVWTGAQALQNGLVDQLGGIDVAIVKAKALAKISAHRPVNLEVYPKPLTSFQQIMRFTRQGAPFHIMGAWFGKYMTQVLSKFMLTAVPEVR